MNTTYFLNLVAGNIFQSKTEPAIPTTYYVGLSSTEPNIDGSNVTEPNGGGYVRVKLTGLSEPFDGVVQNANDINMAESNANWGVMTHYVIFDAETEGNLLMYGQLNPSRTIEEGTVMSVVSGTLKLSVVNV